MPLITLRFKSIKLRDYPLAAGQTLTIGRKHSNDIVIDNLAVSGNHARIESVATTFVLRDLDSTNGTFVNKEKITLHNLRHEDVIMIGKHELVFDHSDSMKAKSNISDDYDVDKTRILHTSAFRDLNPESAGDRPPLSRSKSDSPGETEHPPSFFMRLLRKIFG